MIANAITLGALLTLATPSFGRALPSQTLMPLLAQEQAESASDHADLTESESSFWVARDTIPKAVDSTGLQEDDNVIDLINSEIPKYFPTHLPNDDDNVKPIDKRDGDPASTYFPDGVDFVNKIIMARDAAPQGLDRQLFEEKKYVFDEGSLTRRDSDPTTERRIVCYDAGDCWRIEGVNPLADYEILSVPDPN